MMDGCVVSPSSGGCADAPVPGAGPTRPDLSVTTWTPCKDDMTVRYVVVEGATHAWMGHPAYSELASSYLGEPYPDLDASRAIWSFFALHPRR